MNRRWCTHEDGDRMCIAEPDHDGPHVMRTGKECLMQALVSLALTGGAW